jgi:hypothetical protein
LPAKPPTGAVADIDVEFDWMGETRRRPRAARRGCGLVAAAVLDAVDADLALRVRWRAFVADTVTKSVSRGSETGRSSEKTTQMRGSANRHRRCSRRRGTVLPITRSVVANRRILNEFEAGPVGR